ncbi:MAG: methyl-accepting chemotaxis protein [Bryobacteraceae bacterium]|nr:methyl-accepting chemotaxis protein [Bryobacteraceae bacterium]
MIDQESYRRYLAQIAEVCERVAGGDLEARLIHAPENPDVRRTMIAINQMLDQTDAFVREARVSLECASKGKFYRRFVLRGMKGSFRTGADMINRAGQEMARQGNALQAAEENRKLVADELERTVKAVARAVERSSAQIRSTAQDLASAADKTRTDASQVTSASHQTSESVQGVASATDDLALAFSEIERQANQSVQVATQAVAGVNRINQIISQLNEASTKIGGVIRIISQIARQTNLLALNATIEAARSGDAGRGFAVVASEVKTLAQQTAGATEEIQAEIAEIQKAAGQTATAIEAITGTIHSVDESAKSIVQSVNSQREATSAISQSVEQAATNMQQVSTSISNVRDAAQTTSEAATALKDPADELSQQAADLVAAIDSFLVSLKGA